MAEYRNSIEIERPIEEVFLLTNNHVAEWSSVVIEEEVLHEEEGGVGTRFRSITESNGKRMEFDGTVTHYDPPYANTVELKGEQFDLEVEYEFEDLDGNTRVTQRSHVHPRGLIRLVFMFLGPIIRRAQCDATYKELQRLKTFCENAPRELTESHLET
ncbi:SRPBCC family protein [Thalassoroseus pseudoceratinae]|uniref:SRPBCC family protein n=1 Tax=Thalassoroseus pseudoceratinae TaxID=2713176 RepID=UPI00141D9ED8|nr:SRPBCC family protein [Thalassoroseus pseudoceratinae]